VKRWPRGERGRLRGLIDQRDQSEPRVRVDRHGGDIVEAMPAITWPRWALGELGRRLRRIPWRVVPEQVRVRTVAVANHAEGPGGAEGSRLASVIQEWARVLSAPPSLDGV
jgi:hypothetical protein